MTKKWTSLWALPHYNVLSLQKETSFCYGTTQMRATEVENCTSLQSYDAVYFIFSFVKKKNKKKQMKLWPFQRRLLINTGIFSDMVVNASADNAMGISSNMYSWSRGFIKKFWVWNWTNNSLNKRSHCCMRRWLDKHGYKGCTKETKMLLTISPSPNIENLPLSCILLETKINWTIISQHHQN